MAAGDVWKLILRQTQFLSQYQMSVHLRTLLAPDPTAANFQTVADNFKTQIRAFQNQSINWTSWKAQQVRSASVVYAQPKCEPVGGLAREGVFTAPTLGVGVGEALPPQIASVWTLNTGLVGRSRRGRVYIPGIEEPSQVNGVLVAGAVTQQQTAINTLFGLYGVGGTDPTFSWEVWSHLIATGCKPNPLPPPEHIIVAAVNPGDAARTVSAITLRTTLFTQRRRVPGFGT